MERSHRQGRNHHRQAAPRPDRHDRTRLRGRDDALRQSRARGGFAGADLSLPVTGAKLAKARTNFVCQNCGAVAPRWQGRCDACGAWNSMIEEAPNAGIAARRSPAARAASSPSPRSAARASPRRVSRPASANSTASPAAASCPARCCCSAASRASANRPCSSRSAARWRSRAVGVVYISGEEAVDQVRLRAERLGLAQAPVELAAETKVEDIVATLRQSRPPGPARHRFDPDHVDRCRRSPCPAR